MDSQDRQWNERDGDEEIPCEGEPDPASGVKQGCEQTQKDRRFPFTHGQQPESFVNRLRGGLSNDEAEVSRELLGVGDVLWKEGQPRCTKLFTRVRGLAFRAYALIRPAVEISFASTTEFVVDRGEKLPLPSMKATAFHASTRLATCASVSLSTSITFVASKR